MTNLDTTTAVSPSQESTSSLSESPTSRHRLTYPQDCPAYNAAQTVEKDLFQELLAGLCSGVEQPAYKTGRPRLPLSDMLYNAALKIYNGFSARRSMSDTREAQRKGHTDVSGSFPTLNRTIANPDLTTLIVDLIERSGTPLAIVEKHFSVDSTGFSTSRFDRWFDHKWGKEKSKRQWLKAHAIVGVKTNVVTAIKITP